MEKEIEVYQEEQTTTLDVMHVARQVLKPQDFAAIKTKYGEIIEIKRDGILNLLSSLPVSYNFKIVEREVTEDYALVRVELLVKFPNGIERKGEGVGVCERRELFGQESLHNLITKAETRGMKRATEICFGAIINMIIKEMFYNNLEVSQDKQKQNVNNEDKQTTKEAPRIIKVKDNVVVI